MRARNVVCPKGKKSLRQTVLRNASSKTQGKLRERGWRGKTVCPVVMFRDKVRQAVPRAYPTSPKAYSLVAQLGK